jgi:hypothetical protein
LGTGTCPARGFYRLIKVSSVTFIFGSFLLLGGIAKAKEEKTAFPFSSPGYKVPGGPYMGPVRNRW